MALGPVTVARERPEPSPSGSCRRCEQEERSPNATHRCCRRHRGRACGSRCRGGQGSTCNGLLAAGGDRGRATLAHNADARRVRKARGRRGTTAPRSGGWVAFPEGSPEEAAGAGGPLIDEPDPAPVGQGGSLPPEEVVVPARDGSGGGGGIPWIPAVGLTFAGVGGVAVLRRVRRRSGYVTH